MFLQNIYLIHNPVIRNVKTLVSLLCLGEKYQALAIFITITGSLSLLRNVPLLQQCTVPCTCGRKIDAEIVARCAPLTSMDYLNSYVCLS